MFSQWFQKFYNVLIVFTTGLQIVTVLIVFVICVFSFYICLMFSYCCYLFVDVFHLTVHVLHICACVRMQFMMVMLVLIVFALFMLFFIVLLIVVLICVNILHVFEMYTRALIVAYCFRNGFNTFKRFNVFCFSFNVFENDKGVPNCFTCSYGFNNFIMIFIVCQVFVVFRMCFLTIEITVFISLIVVIVLITKTHTKSYNTFKLIEHFTNISKLAKPLSEQSTLPSRQ